MHHPVLPGEPLAVQLANTIVGDEHGDATDLLRTDDDVTAWLAGHRDALPPGAPDDPPTVRSLRVLRDAIRALLGAAIDGERPDPQALAAVNAAAVTAPERPVLDWPADETPRVVDTAQRGGAKATLATVARSAVRLLGSEERTRLRRCQGPGCMLLFVAANPRRRWCSTATCGNRVRVARHYARHRPEPGD